MRRLGLLAREVMEAAWLATALLIPLFMNKNGSEVFERAKAGSLRGIAVVMLTAWAFAALAELTPRARTDARAASLLARARRHPIVLASAAVFGSLLLSTVLSLSPWDSVWGAYDRAYGAATWLAHAAIFAITVANLRTREQLRRLVTALLLPSIPIAIYAIFQRLGYEPLRIAQRETEVERAVSLLGQPVALAAYLGMLMPFTMLRLLERLRAPSSSRAGRMLLAAPFAAILLLQGIATVFTESRGALLGLGCAAGIGLLAVSAQRGFRRVVLLGGGAVALFAVVLALGLPARLGMLATADGRFERRMADTFAVGGGGGTFRGVTWKVAERVLRQRAALELADGRRDALPALRPLVGYGPETQYGTSPAFYDAELPRVFGYFLVDRYHNDLWDVLLTTGALGLLAWLSLQSLLFQQALRQLGLLRTRARTITFWSCYGGGAAIGALGWLYAQGLPFLFLGLQMGAVLGLMLFLAGASVQKPSEPDAPTTTTHSGLLIACVAAVASHLIETSFSFTVVATGMLFWTVCALLVVTLRMERAALTPSADSQKERTAKPVDALPVATDGALLTLMTIALGFAFLGGTSRATRPGDIFWDALTLLNQPVDARVPVVALLVTATLLGGAFLLALDARDAAPTTSLARRMAGSLAWALPLSLVYWLRGAFILAALVKPVGSDALIVAHHVELRTAGTSWFFLAALSALLLWAVASALARFDVPPARASSHGALRGLAAALCALLAGLLWVLGTLRPAAADAAAAVGHGLAAQNRVALAQQAFERAVAQQPQVGAYHAMLAKTHAKRARVEPAFADEWYGKAEESLHAGLARSAISTEHVTNLASIRSAWAQRGSVARRPALASAVPELYARALRLNPQDPSLWRLWSGAQLNLLHDPVAALASARKSLALSPNDAATHALIADCQVASARTLAGEARRQAFLQAAASYNRAAGAQPGHGAHRINEGQAYLEAGQPQRAVAVLRAGIAALPSSSAARTSAAQVLRRAESALAMVSGTDAAR